MARNVARVLSGSDYETQNNIYDGNEEINSFKRKKKKNSKYQQESENEIIYTTTETKLRLYENSHMSKAQKKLKKKNEVVMDNILNIVSNEHLPRHPFEQKIDSTNNSLILDVASSKIKKKTSSDEFYSSYNYN